MFKLNFIKKNLVTISAVVFSSLAINHAAQAAPVWTGSVAVTQYGNSPGAMTFMINKNLPGASNCKNAMRISFAEDNYKVTVASFLTAVSNGKRINIQYDNAETGCFTKVRQFQIVQ